MSILNEAKLNLKNSLNRLEKAIDEKIKQLAEEREQYLAERDELMNARDVYLAENVVENFSGEQPYLNQQELDNLSAQIQKLTSDISDKADEIVYLREQNSEINGLLGKTIEENNNLKELLEDTKSKVKFIITEVQQYVAND
jgi:predicted  nucleic acid-binding Zn-ribbon protein